MIRILETIRTGCKLFEFRISIRSYDCKWLLLERNIISGRKRKQHCPVGLGSRIHRQLFFQRGKILLNEYPGYDTKQSDDEVPVMLELWGMQSTLSLPLLPGPLWPGVVAPDRILFIGQIELNCVLMLNWFAGNRTVLIFKLGTYSILNCLI